MEIHYDEIAHAYDKGRSYSEDKIKFWMGILSKYGKLRPNSRVLDVGCGTGRYAIPLAGACSSRVIGIDISKRMLEEAKRKSADSQCHWILADAEELPSPGDVFDLCLMSMVVHHIGDRDKALIEVHRVLSPEGICLIRTCSHEQMKGLPDYYFFPEAFGVDVARIPDVSVMKSMLTSAGFAHVHVHQVISPALESAEEYLVKVRNKYTSTFHILSERDFNKGLRRAEEYFSTKPLPEEWKTEPISVVVATKNPR